MRLYYLFIIRLSIHWYSDLWNPNLICQDMIVVSFEKCLWGNWNDTTYQTQHLRMISLAYVKQKEVSDKWRNVFVVPLFSQSDTFLIWRWIRKQTKYKTWRYTRSLIGLICLHSSLTLRSCCDVSDQSDRLQCPINNWYPLRGASRPVKRLPWKLLSCVLAHCSSEIATRSSIIAAQIRALGRPARWRPGTTSNWSEEATVKEEWDAPLVGSFTCQLVCFVPGVTVFSPLFFLPLCYFCNPA